ncbi:MAG TPA: helix-turn-helix domain-containing protein [Ignavibacteria bacterium]
MYSDKQKYEFVSLRAEGVSYEKISKKLNIPIRNLFRWGKDMAEEISACKEAALESVLNAHKASANERISNLALILEKIDHSISGESFETCNLYDLMNWKFKVHNELLKYETKLNKSSQTKIPKKHDADTEKISETKSSSDSDQIQLFNEQNKMA